MLLRTGQHTVSETGLFLGAFGGVVVVLITAIITVFANVIVTLYKAKAKIEANLVPMEEGNCRL